MEGQTQDVGRDGESHVGLTDEDSLLLSRELYLDAIEGVGLPSITIAMDAEKRHMAYFCGNQHNPQWRWRREKLTELTLEQLIELYMVLKEGAL